ncbi:MAG TPA: Flp family type IVb pilin [Candidatus Binatia bacterium]|jgi:pilus assembly protein Flp/PilA|nr:Flp family type IVb pilin [Candidatus Binatia bacterium]
MKNLLCRLHKDENGQDLVEYALVAALIGLGSVTAMKTLSNYISNAFTTVGSTLVSSV